MNVTFTPAQKNWIEASFKDGEGKELQFTSYHSTQLDLLRADAAKYGVSLADNEAILADWVANYTPEPPVILTPEERWVKIKALRDIKTQTGGYKVNNKWFHSDTFSRTQQMGLVMMGSNMPSNLSWKTLDGSFIKMTPLLAQQIFAAAAFQDSALFAYAETLKSNTSLDLELGWPETYNGV